MKKTLIILAAVLLIAGLFIACSADINSANETASVNFGDGAKGLTYTTTPADLPDVNSLIWWYQAENSASAVPGETDGWTRIKPNGVGFATLNGFKIGSGWTFTIAGKVDAEEDTEPASDYTDCVYYGTNDEVTLRRGNNTININLTWVAPTSATVSFSNIAVYESEDEFPQDTNYDTWQIWENEAISGATGTLSSYESTISYNLGSVQANAEHTYIVKVFDYQGNTIASQPVTIYAYPGSSVTVTGDMGELNVSADVIFDPSVEIEGYDALLTHGTSYNLYANLQDAINAATDGDTVKLMRDVTITEFSVLQDYYTVAVAIEGKSLTIDGNNKKITSSITTTISPPNKAMGIGIHGGSTISSDYKNVVIKNLDCDFTGFGYGISALDKINCTITNCEIETDGVGIASNGNAEYINKKYYAWPEEKNALVTVSNSTIVSRSQMTTLDDYKNAALFAAYGGKLIATEVTLTAKYAIGFGSSGATVEYVSGVINNPETSKLCMYKPSSCYYHCTADGAEVDTSNPLNCTIIMHEDYTPYYDGAISSNVVVNGGGTAQASVTEGILTLSVPYSN